MRLLVLVGESAHARVQRCSSCSRKWDPCGDASLEHSRYGPLRCCGPILGRVCCLCVVSSVACTFLLCSGRRINTGRRTRGAGLFRTRCGTRRNLTSEWYAFAMYVTTVHGVSCVSQLIETMQEAGHPFGLYTHPQSYKKLRSGEVSNCGLM